MVSFFLPLVLLPLVQFSNQKQEFLPMVHSCLWCCNNGGTRAFFSGEQGLKISGIEEHMQYWGTGNIENQDFVLGEQGNKDCFFDRTSLVPLKGTGTSLPWKGLTDIVCYFPPQLNIFLDEVVGCLMPE